MKKTLSILLILSVFSFSACSQKTDATQFINKTWQLETEEMSGIGTHIPLPKNTTLVINADNTWSSSVPIDGVNSGTWIPGKKGTLFLKIGEHNTASASLTKTGRLKLSQKKIFAGKVFYWKSE